MSTDQISQRRGRESRSDVKLVEFDEFINAKVESTRRLVKLVDLATSLVLLAAGVLTFLLAAAAVEHWVVPGGFSFAIRAALFALLAGGAATFAYRRIWPLVVRTINPVYAAQTIEEAVATGSSLKNSLINLLLFRQRRSEVPDAVYQTLEEQAAHGLSRVPVDAAVDRSQLIRFGYVLLAVVAVALAYKVLSPKDPWIAAQRVLMPWAEIVPASRVVISQVEPGSVTVSRGEFVDVSAAVRGVGESDAVLVRYTTEDGRAVDKPVPMSPARDGQRFEARLPAGDQGLANVGLAEDLRYRIEAGDARSLDYDVKVVAAPSILVERVDYDYPDYTGDINRSVEALGDIRAIEGTRVTIHARANGPIQEAQVDFNADGRRDLQMAKSEMAARASFELRLREDRLTPQHASYVLRFTNTEGRTNRDPVKYSIHVEPDVAPEASIVRPQEKEMLIRLDETVAIEVEAIDPDFKLAEVRLHGKVAGRELSIEPLLKGQHRGRFTGRHQFTPSAHDLRAGDVVEYWVTANDNRTPEANVAASERQLLRIASPQPAQQPPPDRLAQREPQPRQNEQQPGKDGQQDGQQQEGAGGEGESGEQQPGAAGGEGHRGDQQQPQNGQQDGEPGGESFSRDAQRSAEPGQGDNGTKRQGDKESGEAGGEAGTRQPDEPGAGSPARSEQGEGAQRDQQGRRGERGANDKQTGAGAAGGEPSQEGAQPSGARPDQNTGQPPANGERQRDSAGREPSAEETPISSEGDNDADAFERIRKHLQRDGELPQGDRDSVDANEEPVGRDAQRSAEEGQGDKETRRQGEGAKGRPGEEETADTDRQPGGEARRDDSQKGEEPGPGQPEQGDSPGGQETSTKGPSGAGEEQKPKDAPEAEPGTKPGEKRQQSPSPSEQEKTDSTEPPAGGRGKKESDSQGEQGGDRAGGGEEGGGQKAPRDGTGSAGQNQSADEGAGESTEQGEGTDSPNAGRDRAADNPTGESSGDAAGRGSKQRDGEGQEAGDEAFSRDEQRSAEKGQGDKETGRQGEEQTGDDPPDRSLRDAEEDVNEGGTATGGGGEEGTAAGRPPRIEGTVPPGDEANLDYARKQTDLVLERLAEQLKRKQVDEELLEELGWSEEELQRFVERWQARKDAAQQNDRSGKAAKRELDEALRSLGLRRGPIQQGPLKEDTLRDLREGYRGTVPREYQERLRAYNQGVSRVKQDGSE